jgi:hypothetical protein
MIRATTDAEEVKTKLNASVAELVTQDVALAATSAKRSADPDHPDRLRTMFERRGTASERTRRTYMRAYQVVDSRYALQRLCAQNDVRPFLKAYELTRVNEMGAGQGVFFEHIVHQFTMNYTMNNTESDPVQSFNSVCFSSGTNRECVEQLSSPNVYWVPSNHNFPNIDSALVHIRTLYAFRMTISDTHTFDPATFASSFVQRVREKVEHDLVVVWFLHPRSTDFTLPGHPSAPGQRSGEGRQQDPPIEFREYGVAMESEGSICQSLKASSERCRRALTYLPVDTTTPHISYTRRGRNSFRTTVLRASVVLTDIFLQQAHHHFLVPQSPSPKRRMHSACSSASMHATIPSTFSASSLDVL